MTRPPTRFLDRKSPPHIATLVLIAGLSALAMNIFLPSLPGMAVWFGVPYGTMQQSVTLYIALTAALQIVIGPLSDRFGRRKVTLAALALFLAFTLGTLVAPNATVFLACRMGQAVVAAGMVMARAIVRDLVADAEAASMIGYVTMGMSLVPMIGPLIGGFLDEAFGWQASFGFLFLVGLATLLLVWADLGETSTASGTSFLKQVRQYPRLLVSRRFWGYALSAGFASGAFFAYLGGAPFVGTTVFHLTPAQIGASFALTAIGYTAGNFLAARLSVRVGMNRMVLWGGCITAAAMAVLLALTCAGLSGPAMFFALTMFMGVGNGVSLPNANAGILSVRPELAGTAAGLGGAIMMGGGAALAALTAALLERGESEVPLILVMLVSSLLSALSILWVMRRARALGLRP
ncbi:MAG: multidrug effflux MFS transporter [Rhodobacteraceae bacterium]|nr:multidrug effflux MFS transporter [Paracoccaceae bacterium]